MMRSLARREPPPEPMRLLMAGVMAFTKGAVVSAVAIAPFLGLWAAAGTALAFSAFCVWLAHKKGPGTGPANRKRMEHAK